MDPIPYEDKRSLLDKLMNDELVPKITNIFSENHSSGNILDYGCGPGSLGVKYILPMVERTSSTLYSVDISPKMIEFAKNRYPHERIRYATGYIPDAFPFPEVTFDLVYSINVFHLIADIRPVLRGIKGHLKSGGMLGFTTGTLEHPGMRVLQGLAESPAWAKYFPQLSKSLPKWSKPSKDEDKEMDRERFLRKILVEGLDLEEVYFELRILQRTVSVDLFLDTLDSINPEVHKVPESLRSDLKKECKRLFTTILQLPLDASEAPFSAEFVCAVLKKR